jgi:hypothetical protein
MATTSLQSCRKSSDLSDRRTKIDELMKRMRDSNRFDSVWFYNCGIYGRTSDDKQFKFGLYDDINQRIHTESNTGYYMYTVIKIINEM